MNDKITFGFGTAVDCIKGGERVARAGWNGKGMWIAVIRAGNAIHKNNGHAYNMKDCIGLKNAAGDMQPGWVPSQEDMLSADWSIV